RAVIVHMGLVVETDGVDYEFITLITADRFAIPRWFWILRMRYIQINVPRLLVELTDERDLGRRLIEVPGLDPRIDDKARNARRPASLPCDVRDFSSQHFVVGFFHPFDSPRLQNGIGEIRDSIGRLHAAAVWNIGMIFRGHYWPRPVKRRQKIVTGRAIRNPGRAAVRREVGHCAYCFDGKRW